MRKLLFSLLILLAIGFVQATPTASYACEGCDCGGGDGGDGCGSGGVPPTNPGDPKGPPSITPPDWPPSPLACLPDRVVRWETEKEMEPCHCPPQDYCPDELNITPENVDFFIKWLGMERGGVHNCQVKGVNVEGLEDFVKNGGSLFGNKDEIFNLLNRAIIAEGCDGLRVNNRTSYWWVDITVAIQGVDNLDDWANDTLRMPSSLASRCCDNICPMGLVPKIVEVEVEVVRNIGEGNGSPEACKIATQNLSEAESELAQAEATERELCDPPTGGPGAACDQAKDATDDAQKSVEQLTETKTDACNIPEKVTDTITVETVSCGSSHRFRREGCLIEGTPISMADGSNKAIEALQLGDLIKGNHGPAKVKALTRFTQEEDFMYSINGGEHFFTVEHPVLTKRGWKSVDAKITSTKNSDTQIIGTLKVGDRILTQDGELEVKSIEKKSITGGVSAYNLSVEGDGSFIANGIIMKGFKQMQMHY